MPTSSLLAVSFAFSKVEGMNQRDGKNEGGLTLSREHIVTLNQYVRYVVGLPTEPRALVAWLGYAHIDEPVLAEGQVLWFGQPVALVLDDTLLTLSQGGINLDYGVSGVEQISVIKGPNSTLYGAAALGGLRVGDVTGDGKNVRVSGRFDRARGRDNLIAALTETLDQACANALRGASDYDNFVGRAHDISSCILNG